MYSCSFITLQLDHCCHMDYFNDVLTTFLGLEPGSCVAVYAGSESSWIWSKIAVSRRWMMVLWVWSDLRVRNLWQNFHFWVNYSFKAPVILWIKKVCENSLMMLSVKKAHLLWIFDVIRWTLIYNFIFFHHFIFRSWHLNMIRIVIS